MKFQTVHAALHFLFNENLDEPPCATNNILKRMSLYGVVDGEAPTPAGFTQNRVELGHAATCYSCRSRMQAGDTAYSMEGHAEFMCLACGAAISGGSKMQCGPEAPSITTDDEIIAKIDMERIIGGMKKWQQKVLWNVAQSPSHLTGRQHIYRAMRHLYHREFSKLSDRRCAELVDDLLRDLEGRLAACDYIQGPGAFSVN